MYNQIEAILSQYELEIYELSKGRGTYICNTNKGSRVLAGFRGSKEKGMALCTYLSSLKAEGFWAEQIELNKELEAVTLDEVTGEHFILKECIEGKELNVNHPQELKEAAMLLAAYHNASLSIPAETIKNIREEHKTIKEEKEKHYRELVKIKNYIRSRKKKNEFERIYLNHYEDMVQKAKESIFILDRKQAQQLPECFCHGDYNQHNIIYTSAGWQMINFENVAYRWCIVDLANFLRKMMEKNDWNYRLGAEILESYTKVRPLNEAEMEKLYALLLFPEKFWKVTNHYMNSRKNWISERDIEKLKKVIEQESKRVNFMENLFAIPRE